MKIRWTLPAADQLYAIFDSIAEDDISAAERTVHRIREYIHRLARMPHAGRLGRVAETREVVVPGTSYIVAYQVLEQAVHVLAIVHGARDWPDLF